MQTLSAQLKTVKGKKSYGYLPKSVKKTVDEVVDKLEELPEVRECYEQWCALQSEVDSYYHDKPREKKTLSQEKEFRQIKNAVIQEAERIRLGEIAFEDANLAGHDEAEWVRGESNACWELRQIIRDEYLSLADRDGAVEELEWLAERGDTHAQYLMGQLYRDGPLLIPDSQKAKDWFTQAAEHGLPEAQYALGKLFLSADMEVQDPDEGIRWLKQAAESGSHFAAYRLGKEYLTGEVVAKVVQPVGGSGQPVCPVYAGQVVPNRAGSDSRPDPGNGLVQPLCRPGGTSTPSSFWSDKTPSVRPPLCWRPPACSTT